VGVLETILADREGRAGEGHGRHIAEWYDAEGIAASNGVEDAPINRRGLASGGAQAVGAHVTESILDDALPQRIDEAPIVVGCPVARSRPYHLEASWRATLQRIL